MDKIQKAIAKLPKEYKEIFDAVSRRLLFRDFFGLNITKLKGHKGVFRFRRGRLRIIFRYIAGNLELLEVGLRNESTYRDF